MSIIEEFLYFNFLAILAQIIWTQGRSKVIHIYQHRRGVPAGGSQDWVLQGICRETAAKPERRKQEMMLAFIIEKTRINHWTFVKSATMSINSMMSLIISIIGVFNAH